MVLGAIVTLAFAPFDFWYLLFLSLITFTILLHKFSNNALLTGWCFGFGYFAAGISWVHVSIATFGGLPLIASLLMMALLCGYLAIFFSLAFWSLNKFFDILLWPLAAPLIWLICEYMRANLLTGFPWLSIGYSQIDSPLGSLLPVIGEVGLSALIFGFSLSIAVALLRKKHALILASAYIVSTALSVMLLSNFNWVNNTGIVKSVALVQGNIEQSMRWRPELDQPTIDKYFRLTEEHWDSDLIIWPEAAIPVLESMQLGFETLVTLDDLAEQNQTALVTGAVDYNYRTEESYNFILAVGLDSEGENKQPYYYQHSNRFAKHQLLPIGEFVPFENVLRGLAPIFDLPMSSFNRGDFVQQNLLANGISLVPAICYEIAFPNQVKANITEASDMLLTISNDAWFGDSHGPHQHLQIARMRAIELGLPIIRATNNGVTAAYDAKGVLLGELPQFVDEVLVVDVPLVTGKTPYTLYGNWPIYMISIIMLFIAIVFKFKKSKP